MVDRIRLYLLAQAIAIFTLRNIAKADPQVAQVPAFKVVQTCLPFNLLIQPSQSDAYEVVIDADQAVKAAVQANVDSTGTLKLTSTKDFTTNNSIQVTVRAPSNALAGVITSSALGAEVIVRDFAVKENLTVTNNGATTLSIVNTTAPNVIATNAGAGSFVLEGDYSNVSLTNSGAATARISGVSQLVDLDLSGVRDVYIDAPSDDLKIQGSVGGSSLSGVTYNQGECSLSSSRSSIFGDPCKMAPVSTPSRTIYWTCGLVVKGSFDCQGGSGSASSGGISMTGTGSATSSPIMVNGGSAIGGSSSISGGSSVTASSITGQTSISNNGQQSTTSTATCSSGAQQVMTDL